MATFAKQKWIKAIHTAKNKLALEEDAYRGLLLGAAGVDSSTEIQTWHQYNSIMAAFKKLGFSPSQKTAEAQNERSADRITHRQEIYIRGLWEIASRKKTEESLRNIIYRLAGVNDISFLKKKDATNIILALRKISLDAGINPDRKES